MPERKLAAESRRDVPAGFGNGTYENDLLADLVNAIDKIVQRGYQCAIIGVVDRTAARINQMALLVLPVQANDDGLSTRELRNFRKIGAGDFNAFSADIRLHRRQTAIGWDQQTCLSAPG